MSRTTPVRKGAVYCAPFCGRGCTHAEYRRAVRRARILAKRLGEGWQPEVWENLGWHYKAVSPLGGIKVHPIAGSSSYVAFYGEPGRAGGSYTVDHADPVEAVREVLQRVRRHARGMVRQLRVERRSV